MKKAITIKDALIEDIEFLHSLKTDGITAGGAFTKLVNLAKEPKENGVSQEEYDNLLEVKNSLSKISISDSEIIETLDKANKALTLELEEKNAQIRLNSNAFLIELEAKVQNQVWALRLLLRKQGKIPAGSTEQEFTNRFVNQALKNHINDKYNFLNKD